MSSRVVAFIPLIAYFLSMVLVLRWAFRRRGARLAAGERVGCLGAEAVVILATGAVFTVAMAIATIILSRP